MASASFPLFLFLFAETPLPPLLRLSDGKAAPTKGKGKAAPKKKAKKAAPVDEDSDDEDAGAAKKAKVAPKPKKAAAKKGSTAAAQNARRVAVDRGIPLASPSVWNGHAVMLNQTNISGGNNNNKFYVIQLLSTPDGQFHTWVSERFDCEIDERDLLIWKVMSERCTNL